MSSGARRVAEAHLGSDEGGPDVEAGGLGVRHPLLVDLYQLLDALQHLHFIEQLKETPETELSRLKARAD